MKCFSPITLKTTKNNVKTNVHVPCGKCAACLSRERKTWQTRLELQNRYSTSAKFITLTYGEEFLPYGERITEDGEILHNQPILDKVHVQNFFKRFREKNKNKIKYYLVGEYGETTQRPHYHMLLFNADNTGDQLKIDVLESWGKGSIDIGNVTQMSIAYVLNYMAKDKTHRKVNTFRLMSKGLGLEYANRNAEWHRETKDRDYIMSEDGKKVPIPRYLKQKIYNGFTRQIQAKTNADKMEEFNRKMEEKYLRKAPNENQHVKLLDQQKALVRKQNKQIKNNGL